MSPVHLPILKGLLRGRWWNPASPGKLFRVLLGTYEPRQTQAFVEQIRPGSVVFDIGAHVGYYTLLSQKLVGAAGEVVAFEPEIRNFRFLSDHVLTNGLSGVSMHQLAVGARRGHSTFRLGSGSGTGHLIAEAPAALSDSVVSVVAVDEFVAEEKIQPTHMKIDVEGFEVEVLRGARNTLETLRPTLFLSTHGPRIHSACCQLLRLIGYQLAPLSGDDLENCTEVLCLPPPAYQRQVA